jgi:hypothetical protein
MIIATAAKKAIAKRAKRTGFLVVIPGHLKKFIVLVLFVRN